MNVLAEGVVCGKEGEIGTCTAEYIHVGCENLEWLAFELTMGIMCIVTIDNGLR